MADNLMFLVVLKAQTNMLSGVVEVVGCIPYSHDVQRLSNFWTASQFGSAMHVPNLDG